MNVIDLLLSEPEEDKPQYRTAIEEVYAHLREDVLSGVLPPGERLRVEKLRADFGVSATTVREALSRLMSETLVVSESQKGFRVAPISIEDFKAISALRKELEKMALRESLKRGDDGWEAGIVAAFHKLSKVEELIKVDPEANGARWEKCNLDFHNALVSACQNRWLFYFRNILQSQSSRYLRLALKTSIKERDVHAEHEAIFKAALARNTADISDLIDQHIDRTFSSVAHVDDAVPAKPPVRTRS